VGLDSREARDAYDTWRRLPTVDARAAFATKLVSLLVRNWQENWIVLLDMLRMIRDEQWYCKPPWVGAAHSKPVGYESFAAYFEAQVQLPFDTFVQVETTDQVLRSAGYRLDQLLGMGYGEARDKAVEAQARAEAATEQRTNSESKRGNQNARKEQNDVSNTNVVLRTQPDADYWTARIARDAPDILAEMQRGEHRSVRSAAKKAGLVKERWSLPAHDMAAMARYLRRRLCDAACAELARLLAAP